MTPISDNRRQPPKWTLAHLRRGLLPATLTAVVLTVSCALTPAEIQPDSGLDLPESYTAEPKAGPAPDRWWTEFGSEELNTLVDDALRGNLTLKGAYARLEQARAVAVQAGADLWPDLSLGAEASVTRRGFDDGTTVTSESGGVSLVSSYELDLWGRVRSRQKAAVLDFEATREDLGTAALTIASEVTLRWLDIMAVRQRLDILSGQLETNRTTLELMELRFLKGAASALDVFQQREIVAETMSLIPPLEGLLITLNNELAVLLGVPPQTELNLTSTGLPEVGAIPDAGVPADLLSQRPDVRASSLDLQSAQWRVEVARADRLPRITLTASAGYSSGDFSDIFDNWLANLAGALTAPLIDAGFRRAEVEKQRQVVEERLAAYSRTVLVAIREVEDAMVNEEKQVEFILALEDQLATSRQSHREALERYRKGLNDYLPVLNALTTSQRLERGLVLARVQRLRFRVGLYRALGGSWMSEEIEAAMENRNDES